MKKFYINNRLKINIYISYLLIITMFFCNYYDLALISIFILTIKK